MSRSLARRADWHSDSERTARPGACQMAAEAEELLREVARYSTVLRHIWPLGRNLNPEPISAAQEQTNTTQESAGAR